MNGADSSFRALMERIREGSQDAAWELVSTYGSYVERVIRRTLSQGLRSKYDTGDFIQAVWASFFRDRECFDSFEDADRLVAFLVGIARNKVLQESRKRFDTIKSDVRREESLYGVGDAEDRGLTDPGASPSQWAIARERWNDIMRGHTPQQQRVIQLRISGATFEEIGGELGMSERTARRVIDRLVAEIER
jgi:RNA polymerase sigma factor (sigma-70 family)